MDIFRSVLLIINFGQVLSFLAYHNKSGIYNWTVPAGLSSVYITVIGASGGSDSTYSGGYGAIVSTSLTVIPGQILHFFIGGAGLPKISKSTVTTNSFNGGGCGGVANYYGGGGGGSTDIRTSMSLSTRVVVAGGGGGAYSFAQCAGGNGGNPNAPSAGTCNSNPDGCNPRRLATGATQTGGGMYGSCYVTSSHVLVTGTNGTFGQGGIGNLDGGGGGGGYYGGGGGRTTSGSGGSSFCDSAYCSNPIYSVATTVGDGAIKIQYTPTTTPTINPTTIPSSQKPSQIPTSSTPTVAPTFNPSSLGPSTAPTIIPSSNKPTLVPSLEPSISSTTGAPSQGPTLSPSSILTGSPTQSLSSPPTLAPSTVPSLEPTIATSEFPSELPSAIPTWNPTATPTWNPTQIPSVEPTITSTAMFTVLPTQPPSAIPVVSPTSIKPTLSPSSAAPSEVPSHIPSILSTNMPNSINPTYYPSSSTSLAPSQIPTVIPTAFPSIISIPSFLPSSNPSIIQTSQPTQFPSALATTSPISLGPSQNPTSVPTITTSSLYPTQIQSVLPSLASSATPKAEPTMFPSQPPTQSPSTAAPSENPTQTPSVHLTDFPSYVHLSPSATPLQNSSPLPPSASPSASSTYVPLLFPTPNPSNVSPTQSLSVQPTIASITIPSLDPSTVQTSVVSTATPSSTTSTLPTQHPGSYLVPASGLSNAPTSSPTQIPLAPTTTDNNLRNLPATPSVLSSTTTLSEPPTLSPSTDSTAIPSIKLYPSGGLSTVYTFSPTIISSSNPTESPSSILSPAENSPSVASSNIPSTLPATPTFRSVIPLTFSVSSTETPTGTSTDLPTLEPVLLPASGLPTTLSTFNPSIQPPGSPISDPSHAISVLPSEVPTCMRSELPTNSQTTTVPTALPTSLPTNIPISIRPTEGRIPLPSSNPTDGIITLSTPLPSSEPSLSPSSTLTSGPSESLSSKTISYLSNEPSGNPTSISSPLPRSPNPTILPNLLLPTQQSASLLPSDVPTINLTSTTVVPVPVPTTLQPITLSTQNLSAFPTRHTASSTLNPNLTTFLPTQLPTVKPTNFSMPVLNSRYPTISPSQATTNRFLGQTNTPTTNSVIQTSNFPSSHSPSEKPTIFKIPSVVSTVSTSASPSTTPAFTSPIPSVNYSSLLPNQSPTPVTSAMPTAPDSDYLQSILPTIQQDVDFVSLSSMDTLGNFNSQHKLLLTASIRSSADCKSNWNVSGINTNLSLASILPVTQNVIANKVSSVQLYLLADVLLPMHSYTFTFFCGYLSASVLVSTNAPPLHGVFSVTPTFGQELKTVFLFLTTQWVDVDLPLEYQFGYFDLSSAANLVIQEKSPLNMSSSTLPSGQQSNSYSLVCILQVFDSVSASSQREVNTTVQPTNANSISNFIASQLSNNSSVAVISLIGSVLNKVNCTGALNCGALNRLDCATVDFTCGECFSGYIGESGPHNSLCSDVTSLNLTSSPFSSCKTDTDCAAFQVCNITSRKCFLPSKTCPNDCSARGVCSFVDINSNSKVLYCSVTDYSCQAVCNCFEGYDGPSCLYTREQLQQKIYQRDKLINSFVALNIVNVSSVTLVQRTVTLSSITQNSAEISPTAAGQALEAAVRFLSIASQVGVSYDSIGTILQSADDVIAVSTNNSHFMKTVNLYASLTSSQMNTGQRNVENILNNFRITTSDTNGIPGQLTTISIPQTALEAVQFAESSSVFFAQNASSGLSLKVSIIDTAAKLYANNNSFMSNPLQIKIFNLRALIASNITANSHEVTVKLRNILSPSYMEEFNFTTICNEKSKADSFNSIMNYTCPFSGHLISHNCTGKSGVLTSFCPILRSNCRSFTQSNGLVLRLGSNCHTLNVTATYTTCLCSIVRGGLYSNRRALSADSVDSVEEDSGALQLVAMTEFVASDFEDTFTAAPKMTTLQEIEQVLIVILMFSSLWTGGALLLLACSWRRCVMQKKNKKNADDLIRRRRGAEVSQSPAAIREYLVQYVLEVFPSVFKEKHRIHQIANEIKKHHRYLSLFLSSESGPIADRMRIVKVVQLMTIQSLLMFLLALLYGLQSPADDNSCEKLTTKSSCLSRKSPIDPSQTYCSWNSNDIDSCYFADPVLTFRTVLLMAVLVSFCTALFLRPIEYLCNLLAAPTADSKKVQDAFVKVEQTVFTAARRASTVAFNATNEFVKKLAFKKATVAVAGLESRTVPMSTSVAQELASASVNLIAARAKMLVFRQQIDSANAKGALRSRGVEYQKNAEKFSDDDDCDDDHGSADENQSERPQSTNKKGYLSQVESPPSSRLDMLAKPTQQLFEELAEDVILQRRLLKTCELEEYDRQWGIDPAGEFISGERFFCSCFKLREGAKEAICREIDQVKLATRAKVDKLKLATDEHIGLEILHTFVMDLLGRDTPAAIIFEQKADEDFARTIIVTRFTKIVAAVILFAMNAFFAYYSVLYGYKQGLAWQNDYLFACVAQMFVEIFINETLEVTWMNFFVPTLVADEVQKVSEAVVSSVGNLCAQSSKVMDLSQGHLTRSLVHVPNYLFVSTNVAKAYPDLMESIIVRTFVTHLPGEISKKWRIDSISRFSALPRPQRPSWVRLTAAFSLTFTLMKYLATAPSTLQRMFVRSAQPFFVSAIISTFYIVIESSVNIAIFCILFSACIAFILYSYFKSSARKKLFSVEPIFEEESNHESPPGQKDDVLNGEKDESDSHFNDEKSDFDGGISVSKKSSNNLELSGLNSLDSAQIDVSFGDSLSAVTIEVPSDSNFVSHSSLRDDLNSLISYEKGDDE